MTRRQAAALPLSIGAHGAALAVLVALSLVRAELPEARAASSPPPRIDVLRIPVGSGLPPQAPARRTNRAWTSGPRRAASVPRRSAPVPIAIPAIDALSLDETVFDEESASGLPCVGCEIAGPPGAEAEPAGRGRTAGGGPIRIGGLIREPRKVRHVDPLYPDIARAARVQGSVVLDCTLTPEGRVSDVRVVSGHPLLVPAGAEAVARWLFTPTLLNGVPVPVLLTVTIRFELR